MEKAKRLSEEALQIAVKRTEAKTAEQIPIMKNITIRLGFFSIKHAISVSGIVMHIKRI